jgi:antitoxin ParD1/3/4
MFEMTDNEQLQRDKRLDELRREIQKGIGSGESTPLDIEEIKREGRKRLAARQKTLPPRRGE